MNVIERGNYMSSISVGELKSILENYPDDYEVVMNIKHKYPISKEEGLRGWCAYINGVKPMMIFERLD